MKKVLEQYNFSHYECHFGAMKTISKVLQLRIYWPTLFRDAHTLVSKCDRCQCCGNISTQNEMPRNYILEVEIFVQEFPFLLSNQYIMMAVDYVSMCVEAVTLPTNDGQVMVNFLKKNIFFSCFSTPRALVMEAKILVLISLIYFWPRIE